ncbi:cx9C motif-containing protein 4, mitochondrial [Dioscorea cayenensis subsp. rotundata]|uniref:Cx9C motif-containing protein 4, mitochondrial n=1 Tax=Dioscorea cayennensis subsp. rotundata TaxID=55577 RepID=A0AB40BB75_DIOCR|nr:cx9C motif-containing protein 4, mitochondrial [Dioscorea cayenensis subsp. rotundata]
MRPIVFLFSFVSPETKLSRWESMATGDQKKNKEPCKKEACDIQACLTKNNFNPQRCLKVIELLQSCCEKCDYNSTHCASLSGLLKSNTKRNL